MATITVSPAQDAVTGEIFIAAPPERVFRALTDPKQAPQWWGKKACIASLSGRGMSALEANGPAWASATMARRFVWTANIWRSIRRAFWFIPGSRVGVAGSRPLSAGSWKHGAFTACNTVVLARRGRERS
jgi:hypothetical protein